MRSTLASVVLSAILAVGAAVPAHSATSAPQDARGWLFCFTTSAHRVQPDVLVLHRTCHFKSQRPTAWFSNRIAVVG